MRAVEMELGLFNTSLDLLLFPELLSERTLETVMKKKKILSELSAH